MGAINSFKKRDRKSFATFPFIINVGFMILHATNVYMQVFHTDDFELQLLQKGKTPLAFKSFFWCIIVVSMNDWSTDISSVMCGPVDTVAM